MNSKKVSFKYKASSLKDDFLLPNAIKSELESKKKCSRDSLVTPPRMSSIIRITPYCTFLDFIGCYSIRHV